VIGSGFPARFVDEQGLVIDCYQQPTQIIDEQLLAVSGGLEGLSGQQAAEIAAATIAQALSGHPAALCGQFHADEFTPGLGHEQDAAALLEGTLAAARAVNIPVWTAERWLTFLDARREVALSGRTWDPSTGRLTCELLLPAALDPGLALLVPTSCSGAVLERVQINGAPAALDSTTRGGVEWARIQARPGHIRLDAQYALV
jgi:hypothetical protein